MTMRAFCDRRREIGHLHRHFQVGAEDSDHLTAFHLIGRHIGSKI